MFKPKRSKRARISKNLGEDFVIFSIEDTPSSNQEAVSSLDALYWKEVIDNETKSIISNNTWILTDLPLVIKH